MPDGPIALIAMDMDGTLLDPHQRITPGNLAALRAAADAGVRLAICSGRLPGDVAAFLRDAGLVDCAVLALNGACCFERLMEGRFRNEVLSNDALDGAVRILQKARLPFGCFAGNRLAIVAGDFEVNEAAWGTHTEGPGAPEYLHGMEGLARVRRDGVNKLVCVMRSEAEQARAARALGRLPGLEITSSWPLNLELMPAGVNKGSAVAALAHRLGVGPERVMALGDYDNDAGMLAYAGVGVAMGNASPRARAAAKYVTLGNDEDGVALAIRRYALS